MVTALDRQLDELRPSTVIFRDTFALRERLLAHPLYDRIGNRSSVQRFMEYHVFAVWDFMSLLTRLQLELTTCRVPWTPPPRPDLARFINEIVLGEESDETADGADHRSHFELYHDAMVDVGAPTRLIDDFLSRVHDGTPVPEAFGRDVPEFVRTFVNSNCDLALGGSTHEVAAAFCFGREDVIPEMFTRVLTTLRTHEEPLPLLTYYVERHIEVDGDHHGPLAMQLIDALVGDDPIRLDEAMRATRQALLRRIALWDGVLVELEVAREAAPLGS